MDEFLKKDTDTLCRLVHAATFLQLEELSNMICRALARNIQNSSPKVKEEFFTLCEKSAEVFFLQPTMFSVFYQVTCFSPFLCWLCQLMQGEELNLQENLKDDLRIRLTKKLAAKQKKVLDAVESAKVKLSIIFHMFTIIRTIYNLIYLLRFIVYHILIVIRWCSSLLESGGRSGGWKEGRSVNWRSHFFYQWRRWRYNHLFAL